MMWATAPATWLSIPGSRTRKCPRPRKKCSMSWAGIRGDLMRPSAFFLGVGLLLVLSGCESTRWGWLKNDNKSRAPTSEAGLPTVAALIDYMNDNAARVQNIKVQDVDLTCTQNE